MELELKPTTAVNNADFMGLPRMLEAFMAKLDRSNEKMEKKLEGIFEAVNNLKIQITNQLEKVEENSHTVTGKLEKLDENAKHLSWKIDESARSLSFKMDENYKSFNAKMYDMDIKFKVISEVFNNMEKMEGMTENVLRKINKIDEYTNSSNVKIDEITKIVDSKVANRDEEIQQSYLESCNNLYKQLEENTTVLSNLEIRVNKHLETAERKSDNVDWKAAKIEKCAKSLSDKIDENVKSLRAKIDENSKTLIDKMEGMSENVSRKINKIDEYTNCSNVKIEEITKIVDARMANRDEEIQQSYLESCNNLYKQIEENTTVLSNLEIRVKKHLETAERKSDNVDWKAAKIEKSAKSLSDKIDENVNSLRAKIDENSKTLLDKMEKKLNKIQQTHSDSSNIKKKLQEMSQVLSTVEVQVNKQLEMAERKSTEVVKSDELFGLEETYDVNLGLMASEDQKCYLQSELETLIAKINLYDGIERKLNFSQMDEWTVLRTHKRRFKKGVKYHSRISNTFLKVSSSLVSFSLRQIDNLFSTISVPVDFSSFVIIILKKINLYDHYNILYNLSVPFYD